MKCAFNNLSPIEADVRDLSELLEKCIYVTVDAKVGKLRAAFQSAWFAYRAMNIQIRICRSLELPETVHPHSLKDFVAIIEAMEKRGSSAGDHLKTLLPTIEKFYKTVEKANATGSPVKIIQAIREQFSQDGP